MKPKLVFVLGPTASGKTALAVDIAERSSRRPEIINCDSIQFFQGVDIGAAKPSMEDLKRVPHHLVGHLEKGAEYTAGDFRRDALKIIESGSAFLPTGGSGFYIQALERGMFEVPDVDPSLRERLELEMVQLGPGHLHAELRARDPQTAERIQPQDRYRILRALELVLTSGATLSEVREKFARERPPPPFEVQKLGLVMSRERLRERIVARTQAMLRAGWIEEVEELRRQGFKNWPPLSSVGYKEIQMALDGALNQQDLEERIVISTFQLAKRQMTWFRRDPQIRWFDGESERVSATEFAVNALET